MSHDAASIDNIASPSPYEIDATFLFSIGKSLNVKNLDHKTNEKILNKIKP